MKRARLWFTFAAAAIIGAGWLTLCSQAQPWAPGNEPAPASATPAPESSINWQTNYFAALARAASSNQLVVVDFYATRCVYCRLMDLKTFTDTNVQQQLAGFVPLKIDTDAQQDVAAYYGIQGLPTMLVIDSTGKPVLGTVGYVPPDFYLKVLDMAKAKVAGTNTVASAAK